MTRINVSMQNMVLHYKTDLIPYALSCCFHFSCDLNIVLVVLNQIYDASTYDINIGNVMLHFHAPSFFYFSKVLNFLDARNLAVIHLNSNKEA